TRTRDALPRVRAPAPGAQPRRPPAKPPAAGPPPAGPAAPFQPRAVASPPDGSRRVLTTRRTGDAASPEALAVLDLATGALDRIAWDLPGRQKEPTLQQAVDLAVQAPPEAPAAVVGTPTAVAVPVTHRGPSPAPGSVLTVAVPTGVRLDALSPATGTCAAGELRCDFGVLAPGASVAVTADLVGLLPGRWQLDWSVAGTVLDAAPSDNAASTVLPVGTPAVPPPPPPPPAPPAPPPPAGPRLAVKVQPDPSFVGGRATVS